MSHIHIGMIGCGFMGRVHSSAWQRVAVHFPAAGNPILHTVCGQGDEAVKFAARWGWRNPASDIQQVMRDREIDLIDIVAPNAWHAELAIAAAEAGKAVACEKPLACSVHEAAMMVQAVEKAGVPNFAWFNYRRVPALAFAKQLVNAGRIGRVRHVRAAYLQDWLNKEQEEGNWRLRPASVGGGASMDLAIHSIDLIRYLTGSEFTSICARASTVVTANVDDAMMAICDLDCGATVSLEATRCGTGHANDNAIEINGEHGSLRFRLPEFSYLEFWDERLPSTERGWRRISVTGPETPYGEAYWPADHAIGYGETFVNAAADMLKALARPVKSFSPTFRDALRAQEVVEAMLRSAKERRWVDLREVKQ